MARRCRTRRPCSTIATGPGTRLWERRRGGAGLRPGAARGRRARRRAPAGRRTAARRRAPRAAPTSRSRSTSAVRSAASGVAGPPDEVEAVIRHVLGQVAALHSPRDLRVARRAPTRRTPDGAALVGTLAPAHDGIRRSVDLSRRAARSSSPHASEPASSASPVDPRRGCSSSSRRARATLGAGELVDLLERGRDLGVWCLVGARTAGALPRRRARRRRSRCQWWRRRRWALARLDVDGAEPVASFTADLVGWWWGERLGRSLAPLVDAVGRGRGRARPRWTSSTSLPWLDDVRRASTACALAAALAAGRAGDRSPAWVVSPATTWTVDLAADGPHVLVGGTTGSGKSELLRTLVTSLALECSPEDMTFVLVDYKGGCGVRRVRRPPAHRRTGDQPRRGSRPARPRSACGPRSPAARACSPPPGARDFDDHRRRAGGLARLVIVIDEFRLLADELPDFVDGVVSLAAVGRSLGVHLVLATQRPAGAVTADIQANVNLRIAMRVRDVADSTDVIGAPDAARIARRPAGSRLRPRRRRRARRVPGRPGRARRGRSHGDPREVLDATGRPTGGLERPSSARHRRAGLAVGPVPTLGSPGLSRIAATAREAAAQRGAAVDRTDRGCHRCPRSLGRRSRRRRRGGARRPRREQQRQDVARHARPRALARRRRATVRAHHDPAHGARLPRRRRRQPRPRLRHRHQRRARRPRGAARTSAPSSTADDVSRVRRLLDQLRSRSDQGSTRPGAASVLLLVDGWERLDSDGDLVVGGLRDELLDLLRSGGSGLRAVVTGDRSVLSSRLGAVASETFLLPLADPSDATYAGLSRRDLPSSRAPGRALRLRDRAEVQFALRDPVARRQPGSRVRRHPSPCPGFPRSSTTTSSLARAPLDGGPSGLARWPWGCLPRPARRSHLDPEPHGRGASSWPAMPGPGARPRSPPSARSAMAAGRQVAVVEGRGGGPSGAPSEATRPSIDPWDVQAPASTPSVAHPDLVVLIDDAERLDGTPSSRCSARSRARGPRRRPRRRRPRPRRPSPPAFRGIVAGGRTRAVRHPPGPRTPSDGEPFGIRAPRGLASTCRAERCWSAAGSTHEIQVRTGVRVASASAGDEASIDGTPSGPRVVAR